MRNGTILTLHIIPDLKLYTIRFQMVYNVAVCRVGTLNFSNNAFLEFDRSTIMFKIGVWRGVYSYSQGDEFGGSNECCLLTSNFDAKNHGVKQRTLLISLF